MIKINGQEIGTKRFPNGEVNLDADKIKNAVVSGFEHAVYIDFKYESDADLMELLFVKAYIDDLRDETPITSFTLDIYYMPYSRMDRKISGQVFTLEYVSKFINMLNFDGVFLNEPHSDVSRSLLNNSYDFYHNKELLPLVKEDINFDEEKDYIVFPDEGAVKRYEFRDMLVNNSLVGVKSRDLKTGEIKSLEIIGENKFENNKAIIIDDLSSYGGTFVRTANLLIEQGFGEVYLLVGHAENAILEGDVLDVIKKVYTTDTILNTSTVRLRAAERHNRIKVYLMDEKEVTGWR